MRWLKTSLERQFKIIYIPAAVIVAIISVLAADYSLFQIVALFVVIGIIAAIHWDLRDGGTLSKLIYKLGGSFEQRNLITVSVAFLLITLILALTKSFASPIILIYCIPIVYASMRGGHRLSIPFGMSLTAITWAYFFVNSVIRDEKMVEINMYLALFVGISTATGFIADRLRRAAVDLSALYETGRSLSATLDSAEILKLAMNIILMDIKPDVAAIFIMEDKNLLKIKESYGFTVDVGQWEVPVGRGLVGKAAERSESILVSTNDRRWRLSVAHDIDSKVAVPITFKNKIIGIILVGRKYDHTISFENLRFLESLASQLAISFQNAELYKKTKEWASLDGMTAVYNFRYFSERLEMEWNRAIRYEKPLSMIMIDLDHFKSINDTYGHMAGDKVLRDFAGLLKKYTRDTDIVARYGGEEFVVVLPETHYDDAYVVAEKLRSSTEEAEFKIDDSDEPVKITISLGISNYPTTAFTKDDLIYQSDQALYHAKSERNKLSSPLDQETALDLTKEFS